MVLGFRDYARTFVRHRLAVSDALMVVWQDLASFCSIANVRALISTIGLLSKQNIGICVDATIFGNDLIDRR